MLRVEYLITLVLSTAIAR